MLDTGFMTFDDYQAEAKTFALSHPDQLMGTTIYALGLAGEAREAVDK